MNRSRILSWAFAVGLAGIAPGWQGVSASAAEPLRVVLDRDNLPFASEKKNPPGIEYELAAAVAKRMKVELEPVWLHTDYEGLITPLLGDDDDKPAKDPQGKESKDDKPQVTAGVIADKRLMEDEENVGEMAAFSVPYAQGRYVLVTRKAAKDFKTMKDVGRSEVGAESGSMAWAWLWNNGYLQKRMTTPESLLGAIAGGQMEFGLLWTSAGWLIDQNPGWKNTLRVQRTETGAPGIAWNMAMAVSKENAPLLESINPALQAMLAEGEVEAIFAKYHTPYFKPMEETK